MNLSDAKQAHAEAVKKSRKNGDRVDRITREVDRVEAKVQKVVNRFKGRLERCRAKLAAAARERADPGACDGVEGGE